MEQKRSSYAKVTTVLPRPLQQISAPQKSHFQGVDLCSDSINLIDLRVLHPDLHSTFYPDGGNPPVGVTRVTTFVSQLKEICPRGNSKVVIYISLYHDKCLLFMLELY